MSSSANVTKQSPGAPAHRRPPSSTLRGAHIPRPAAFSLRGGGAAMSLLTFHVVVEVTGTTCHLPAAQVDLGEHEVWACVTTAPCPPLATIQAPTSSSPCSPSPYPRGTAEALKPGQPLQTAAAEPQETGRDRNAPACGYSPASSPQGGYTAVPGSPAHTLGAWQKTGQGPQCHPVTRAMSYTGKLGSLAQATRAGRQGRNLPQD